MTISSSWNISDGQVTPIGTTPRSGRGLVMRPCKRCGTEFRAVQGRQFCSVICRDSKDARTKYNSEAYRARMAELRRLGLCVVCRKRKTTASRCVECARQLAARRVQ